MNNYSILTNDSILKKYEPVTSNQRKFFLFLDFSFSFTFFLFSENKTMNYTQIEAYMCILLPNL
jgi:hypothetical protein